MSNVFTPTAAASAPGNVEIVPIGRRHMVGFHAALDSVAREHRYLAMQEAPAFARTRRFVLNSLKEGSVHMVAVANDAVVGWCDLRPKTVATLRHTAVLGMGIVTAWRGRGIGSRLLAATIDLARARGIRRFELIVRSDNAAAIALYRKFGFVDEGTCRNYMRVDDVDYDSLLMARLDPATNA